MRTVLYYAAGGGLGHLTRAAAFLHTRGLETSGLILTSLAPELIPAGVTEVPVLRIPPELHTDAVGLSRWIEEFLRTRRIEVVHVDAFPLGILGEWEKVSLPPGCVKRHVARLVAWERYRRQVAGDAVFDVTYVVEPLHHAQHEYLAACSRRLEAVDLVDPPVVSSCDGEALTASDWLIVHSGPTEEVEQLVRYAGELRRLEGSRATLALATRCSSSFPGIRLCPDYPASRWFPVVGRVLSGAGFNVMRQMRPWAGKHRFLPFERRFDDQFTRARLRREEVAACPTA